MREETPTEEADVIGVRLTSTLARALYPAPAAMQLLERLLALYELRAGAPFA